MPKTLVVGFDGFVDTLARPVLQTSGDGAPAHFYPTIPSLGEMLAGQGGKSCSVELQVDCRRAGGNAPQLAAGAAALGMRVSCIGMLGENGIDPAFKDLPATLYSYLAPGAALALEFDDGKVFLAEGVPQIQDPWALVEHATAGAAARLLAGADALAFVNWSEVTFMHTLWKSALHALEDTASPDKSRTILFDLSDCTRRPDEELEEVLRLMGAFSSTRTTLLSLNENEADVLGRRVLKNDGDLRRTAAGLRDAFGLDEILVHTREQSILHTPRGLHVLPTRVVERPAVSTGAGDRFNAASLHAAAHGLDDEGRLAFANDYVRRYLLGEGEKA